MRRAHHRLPVNQIDVKDLKGYCLICGRKLTSEESKRKGMGGVCERKAKRQRFLF